jgi:hypothetical protein
MKCLGFDAEETKAAAWAAEARDERYAAEAL